MKYLAILLILMPVMCQATMSAKDARNRTNQANENRESNTNAAFIKDVTEAIVNAVRIGDCEVGQTNVAVKDSIFLEEVKELRNLGYKVSIFDSRTLNISWCKE
jgi:hypothetical protein